MRVFFNWVLFLAIIVAIWATVKYWHVVDQHLPTLKPMTGLQVVVFALALAFAWVEVLKWGVTKPFNCIKCLTGWFAFILAILFHVEYWYMYLPLGLLVGSVFEGIKMRWL